MGHGRAKGMFSGSRALEWAATHISSEETIGTPSFLERVIIPKGLLLISGPSNKYKGIDPVVSLKDLKIV